MIRIFIIQLFLIGAFIQSVNAQWVHYDSTYVGDEYNDDILFIHDSIFIGHNSIYVSPGDGNSWTQRVNGLTASPNYLFYKNNVFFTAANYAVFRSFNSCQTWQLASNGLVAGSAPRDFCEMGNNIIVASQGGTFLSENLGDSWQNLNSPYMESLRVGANDSVIFAMIWDEFYDFARIFKSTDTGATWSFVMNPFYTPSTGLDILVNENKVYIALTGLRRSLDGGNTWSLITTREIRTLFSYNDFLLMGNDSLGVLLLNDTSTTVIPFNQGLPNQYPMWVRDFAVYNGYLYASIMCYNGPYGLWKRPLSDLLNVNEVSIQVQINIFPNPAKDRIYISIPKNEKRTIIAILDLQGRLIKSETITDEQSEINVSELPSGMYLLKVENEQGVITKKIIVQH